ncbi:hypothetical protein NLM65_26115 [Klebsiella variicola]|nr:hypothetical protein [Klebsiella variicola]MCP3439044.1 hypothetical protein [Klebsiella variicola]
MRNVTTLKALKIMADFQHDDAFQAFLDAFAAGDDYWQIDGNGQTLIIS